MIGTIRNDSLQVYAEDQSETPSEAQLAWEARLDFAYQGEKEWPTWLLAAEMAVCDHYWKDESYGGPDSGCIDMTCTKCGASFHETLY